MSDDEKREPTPGSSGDIPWEAAAEAAAQFASRLAGVAAGVAQEGVKQGVKYSAKSTFRREFGGPPFFFGHHRRGPWGAPPPPPPPPPWGGAKAKRGDVRAAILRLLAEGPRNGYQIIQDAEERTEGAWRPSPGAVYPALQQLADEGLIEGVEEGGRKIYSLTEEGRAYIDEQAERLRAPWDGEPTRVHGGISDLFKEAAQMGGALMQVVNAGNDEQLAEARRLLATTRRRLYGLLAEDEPPAAPQDGEG